jgi:hypothetical protein
MAALWQTLTNWFVRPAAPLYYGRIPDMRAPNVPASAPVKVGQAYFRLWLSEMYLKNDRTWFQEWYPVSHALVQLRYGDASVTVPYVAGPGSLKDLDADHLNRVIQLNHALTGLLPFNGGSVSIQAGLMAMKGGNQLASVIKVVSDISGLLAVPQLSTVLNVAAPVANGVQGLLTSSSGGLQLGLQQTFTAAGGGANELRSGYFVAIAAPEANARPDGLWVVNDRLCIGDSPTNSEPYTTASYMLFRLEVREEHENYEGFTTIQSHVNKALAHLTGNRQDEAVQEMRLAASEVLTSRDLTIADRTRRISELKKVYEEAKMAMGAMAFDAVSGDASAEERIRAVSTATKALEDGPVDFATAMRSFQA